MIGLVLFLAAHQMPSIAAPASPFCQTVQREYAYSQWQTLAAWLNPEINPTLPVPNNIANQIIERLIRAQGRPQEIVLGIDRLTLAGFGSDKPELSEPLLALIDRMPNNQRSTLLPAIDQLVKAANSLPAGYNSAQSRALIVAAHAYQKLGQPHDRAIPLLQKASQIATGIRVPLLRSTVQWRLAQSYNRLKQNNAEMLALEQAANSIKSRPRQKSEFIGTLLDQLIDRYLTLGKIDHALAIADSLNLSDEGFRQIGKIVAAYQRANQPKIAQDLFTNRLNQLSQTTGDFENWTYTASEGIIALAQAGGMEPAAIAVAKLPVKLPHLRARAWLAIAGTARQRGQTQRATVAYQQFLAAGKAGKAIGFGMGFGDQRDYEWSQPLYQLARKHGYEPEMQRFIQDLKLQSEGAEFLITEAIRAKQFEQAKRLVPRPMWRAIDAGMFEVQNAWLLRVAAAAAAAGQPQQLIELSQSLLSEMNNSEPINLMLLGDVQQLLEKLKQHQQDALIAPFIPKFVQQAELLLTMSNERWASADDLARYLQKLGYENDAAKIRQAVVQRFLLINDRHDRLRQLQNLYQWRGIPLSDLLALGQQVQVDSHPEFAGWIYGQAAAARQFNQMEQWAVKAAATPIDQLQIFASMGGIFLTNQQPDKAIVWFDRALAAIPSIQLNPKNSEPAFQSLINGYLYFGKVDKAKQAAKAIANPADRQLANDRLACF
jgi:hypothetical protein